MDERKGKLTFCPGTNVSGAANNPVEWRGTLYTHRVNKKHLASVFKAAPSPGAFGKHCASPQCEGQGRPVDRSRTFQPGTSALCGAYAQPGECH